MAKLRPLDLIGQVFSVYRAHWYWLIGAAVLVFAPLAVLDALAERLLDDDDVPAIVGASVVQTALHIFGDAFYSGVVSVAVIAWHERGVRHGLLYVARTLPWATVVILDLILAVGTTALLVLLVLPGIVFGVVYGLAPAIAKLDHVGVRAALTESRRRVLPSFWRVALVLAIFALSRGVVEQVLQSLHSGFVGDALIHLGVQAVGAPLAGLAVVLMAIELGRMRAG